jgi:hypothetical protein
MVARALALVAALLAATASKNATAAQLIPDSLVTWHYRNSPSFELTSTGNVNSNDMGGKFINTLVGINGLAISTTLSVSKTSYRLQDRRDETRLFSNSISRLLRPGLTMGLSYNDNRRLNRTALITGGFQDFIINSKVLQGNAGYSVRTGPLDWDSHLMLMAQDNGFAFKNDRGQGGQVNGGVGYGFWDNERAYVTVRAAHKQLSEKSTSSLQVFDGLSTSEDSLSTEVTVQVLDSLDIGADWMDYSSERVFADQSRSASGAQNIGAENLFRETERRDVRRYGVNMNTSPVGGLNLKVSAGHSEEISDYVETPTRYSRTVEDNLSGDLSYHMDSGMGVALKLENSEALRDLGPQSVSSYNDVRKRVSLSLDRTFSKTFNMSIAASQSIAQAFYIRYADNPRDRDQLDSAIRANITSSPFNKISTQMYMSYTVSDFINIDASQAENNRRKERYDFRPTITYRMNERVSVEQKYGLAIEFTDFTFTSSDNFLDRNVSLSNRVSHQVTKRLRTEYFYSYVFHDRGSYLPVVEGGERFLDIDRKDRTDRVELSFAWKVTEHVTLLAKQDYSQRRDETVGGGRPKYSTDGGIEGGAMGGYNWGTGRDLSFVLKRTERFSPFGTDDQKKYWTANLSFKYAF